jgi:cbb3-type cytochrome oxidase subunit 3
LNPFCDSFVLFFFYLCFIWRIVFVLSCDVQVAAAA